MITDRHGSESIDAIIVPMSKKLLNDFLSIFFLLVISTDSRSVARASLFAVTMRGSVTCVLAASGSHSTP